MTAPQRVLEQHQTEDYIDLALGEPNDPANPVGYGAFLDADERHELLTPAERILDRAGVNHEFVPRAWGGRLTTADRLGRVLRPLFARDAALGLSYGTSNLIATTSIWSSTATDQKRRVAQVLLANGLVGPGYTDLTSGNDLAQATMRGERSGDGWLLDGRKEMINNIERADLVTLLVRTDDEGGSRAHSLFLLERSDLDGPQVHWHRRYRTSAVRGLPLAGLDLAGLPVPGDRLVGAPGEGFEDVLRGFQLTRVVLPSAALGTWDAVLRLVLDFASSRPLYGSTVAGMPHVQARLTDAFADLLLADALCTTVARGLHLLPRHTAAYAPAVKAFVPPALTRSFSELGAVLGARSFLRDGQWGLFQKHLRDAAVATLVHANATVCQATVIPQLHRASRAWLADGSPMAPPGVFDDSALDDLDFGALRLVMAGGDPLLTSLVRAVEDEPDPGVHRLLEQFRSRVAGLHQRVAALSPRECTTAASPEAFDCAVDYVTLLAAAAAAGIARVTPATRPWLPALLARAGRILTHPLRLVDPVVSDSREALYSELGDRYEGGRSFDLRGRLASPTPESVATQVRTTP